MNSEERALIGEFEELIGYSFQNKELLIEALTTPRYGYEMNVKNYEILETLGDAVLKLVLILKKFKEGEKDPSLRDPGKITQSKQMIENDEMLVRIATDYFSLQDYIFKSPMQHVEGTKILADVFEAICGALYLDADLDIKIVERKIVDVFYEDWEDLTTESSIFNKNILLEYLQKEIHSTPKIKLEYEKLGPDHDSMWIAKNPKIVDSYETILSFDLPEGLRSRPFKKKQKAEQNIYYKIFNELQKRENQ